MFIGKERIQVPNIKLYFCARNDGRWLHQGDKLYLENGDVIRPGRSIENDEEDDNQNLIDPDDVDTDIENINTDNLQKDTDVNKNGQKQSEVIVETFSYLPQQSKIERLQENILNSDIEFNEFGNDNSNSGVDFIDNAKLLTRWKRQTLNDSDVSNSSLASDVPSNTEPVTYSMIKMKGLRVEEADKEPKIVDGMIPSVLRETNFHLRLFGDGFTKNTRISFTHTVQDFGSVCDHLLDGMDFGVSVVEEDSALFILTAPPPEKDYKFYVCLKNNTDEHVFRHQGSEEWKILATHNKLLPLWASLILIVILLMLASLFSGLNLGLMALDRTELKIIANTGTEKERKYARAIMPVRAHGNYLLCTILLSNVAVNSTFTVILDDLTSGLVAVIGSTLAIVFIAEITPQAICARHGLLIGAKSIWIMKIVMGICAPLAWPTSKLLDYFLGEEIGTHYNRERLKELVKVCKKYIFTDF
ncbi:metal transporter cnnm-2-like [Hyposmocoma kahamanoa]|uniref:metal transporter cnnm-2-like n=1 Tax=Hyposmocoma kahamanoa TaxID=1477025 RepID=UPI000E6D693D|nr:metal transporter cnnm-2-like [Hyposmocoma kahamanoa]